MFYHVWLGILIKNNLALTHSLTQSKAVLNKSQRWKKSNWRKRKLFIHQIPNLTLVTYNPKWLNNFILNILKG